MEHWHKMATPRKGVKENYSFNPAGLAIHLEQVVAKTTPEDYQERGSDFLCLSNALSALYSTGSEEKRLLDAMLLSVPR
jgi:hypothetical protein